MNNHVSTSFLVLLSSLGACTDGEPGHDGIDDTFLAGDGKADGSGITDGTPEARAVLRVANGASAATLKADVGLYAPTTA
jgi:hypothetical protein